MFAENGAFFPTSWALRQLFANEHHQPQQLSQSKRGTNVNSNAINEHWIVSKTKLDKNRSPFVGSKFIEFTTNNYNNNNTATSIIHNDENDGLVFGSTQQFCDPKQYDWV